LPGSPTARNQRRKVVRVITVYAATAFVILELTDIVAPSLGLPDWTLDLIIILLCVGFMITVIVSWIYDVHPEAPQQGKISENYHQTLFCRIECLCWLYRSYPGAKLVRKDL